MKSKTSRIVKATPKEVIGSGFACYLHVAYRDLTEKLGEPHDRTREGKWQSSDQKVRVEWAFKVGTGKRFAVMTIYDYKERQPIEETTEWHVGAKGNRKYVHDFLKSLFPEASIEIRAIEKH